MINSGLLDIDIKTIQETLRRFTSINTAILFGSRAKGTYRKGSDIDLALKGDVDTETLVRVSYILNEETLLPYHFDILNYQSIQNIELKEHIDRIGIILYHK